MDQTINIFQRELRLRSYRQSSIDTYTSCLKMVIAKIGFNPSIEEIKTYLLSIKTPSYHKQFAATIHRYFEFVIKKKLSLDDIPYPKRTENLPEIFSIDEIKLLFGKISNLKHRLVVSLLYGCGLRIGELIDLKLDALDHYRQIINVRDAKGGKDRQVMLPENIYNLYLEYKREFNPEIYVLNGQKKLQYTESSVNQLLKYYAKKAGIKKNIHAHLLRHSFATHLLDAGTDMAIIQDLLGHANQKTTRIYAKLSTRRIAQVQSPMQNIL